MKNYTRPVRHISCDLLARSCVINNAEGDS